MDEIRHKKLEEQLCEEIAGLLLSGEVKDPRVGPFVSITRVDASGDLSAAKVYISSFDTLVERKEAGGTEEADANARLEEAAAGLNSAAGFIQSQIGKRIHLRLTPRLSFIADHGIKEGFELNERIKGLLK
jgi:ribosome-binding factor A